jgi:hypothetical protein
MKLYGPKRMELNPVKAQIVKSYENGFSLREIAAWHNASHGSIRALLIEEGVKMRNPGRHRKEK